MRPSVPSVVLSWSSRGQLDTSMQPSRRKWSDLGNDKPNTRRLHRQLSMRPKKDAVRSFQDELSVSSAESLLWIIRAVRLATSLIASEARPVRHRPSLYLLSRSLALTPWLSKQMATGIAVDRIMRQ